MRHVGQASTTGHATNIIAGIGVSMKSTGLAGGCRVRHHRRLLAGGSFNRHRDRCTSHAVDGGIVVALDAYGPITDNAGGIAGWRNCRQKCATSPIRSTLLATLPRR